MTGTIFQNKWLVNGHGLDVNTVVIQAGVILFEKVLAQRQANVSIQGLFELMLVNFRVER